MKHRFFLVLAVSLLFITTASATAENTLTNPHCYTDSPDDTADHVTVDNLLLAASANADSALGHAADIKIHGALARAANGSVAVLAADAGNDRCGTATDATVDDEWDEFYPVATGDLTGDGADDLLLSTGRIGTDSRPLMYPFPIDGTGVTTVGMSGNSGEVDGWMAVKSAGSSGTDASESEDDVHVAGWQSVTIPGKSVEQDSYREGDDAEYERKTWGHPSFDDLEMERGVKPGDTKLHDWFVKDYDPPELDASADGDMAARSDDGGTNAIDPETVDDIQALLAGKADAARKEIAVKMQDEEGNTQTQWELVAGLSGGGDTVGGLVGSSTHPDADDDSDDSGAQSSGGTDEQERGITINVLLEDADGDGTPDNLKLARAGGSPLDRAFIDTTTKALRGDGGDQVSDRMVDEYVRPGDGNGSDDDAPAVDRHGPMKTGRFEVVPAPDWWSHNDTDNTVVPGWMADAAQLADEQYTPDALPGVAKRVMAERMLIEIAPADKKIDKKHKLAVETSSDGDIRRVALVDDEDAFDEQAKIKTDAAAVQMIMDADQPGQMATAAYRNDYITVQGAGLGNTIKYGVMNALGKLGMSLGLVGASGDDALAEEELQVAYDKMVRTE